jgi:hypothetical protein
VTESLVLWAPPSIKTQRAAMLRYMDRVVEIAKLPPEQQSAPMQALEATVKDQPVLVRLLVPAVSKVSAACQRSQALLRCGIVAVAAERYRKAKGQWPESPDALKDTGYLKDVPADPYSGQPLRLRRLDDGLAVYSVGPEGKGDGSKINPENPSSAGSDLGFRLWDVARRRQPPAPPKPPAPDGMVLPGGPPGGEGR